MGNIRCIAEDVGRREGGQGDGETGAEDGIGHLTPVHGEGGDLPQMEGGRRDTPDEPVLDWSWVQDRLLHGGADRLGDVGNGWGGLRFNGTYGTNGLCGTGSETLKVSMAAYEGNLRASPESSPPRSRVSKTFRVCCGIGGLGVVYWSWVQHRCGFDEAE